MEYSKVFTNSNIIVRGLTNLFDDSSIIYIIKDKFESSRLAGFGESSNSVEVHVLNSDIDNALEIVKKYELEINS